MTIDPKLRLNTISYPGGTCTALNGLLTHLFGSDSTVLAWRANTNAVNPVTGRRRRKYSTRQRSSARAGQVMQVVLKSGEKYSVRVTGTHTAFIDYFMAEGAGDKIANVYSQRGTEYGPTPKKPAGVPS